MIGALYYGSLIMASVAVPVLAWRLRAIRWRYKLPLCVLIANTTPLVAIGFIKPVKRIGPTGLSLAMFFGAIISLLLVLPISLFLRERSQ